MLIVLQSSITIIHIWYSVKHISKKIPHISGSFGIQVQRRRTLGYRSCYRGHWRSVSNLRQRCYKEGDTLAWNTIEISFDLISVFILFSQGYLVKKGFLLPTNRYYWFVLRPGELSYYKDAQQKDPAGVISLNINCWADAVNNSGRPDRKFILSTTEHKAIELIAEDHRGRLQWLAALQIAIDHSGERISYQRSLAIQRRSMRIVNINVKRKLAKNKRRTFCILGRKTTERRNWYRTATRTSGKNRRGDTSQEAWGSVEGGRSQGSRTWGN